MRQIGTLLFTLLFLNVYSQSWHKIFQENGLSGIKVSCLTTDQNGRVWMGTGTNGIYVYDGSALVNYNTTNGLVSNSVSALTTDPSGKIWIGSLTGLSCWDNGTITSFNVATGMQAQTVNALGVTLNGILWIGTNSGLLKYNGSSFIQYTTANGLLSNHINAIDVQGNNLWIGTYAGLNYFDGNSFHSYTIAQGLPGNRILSIYSGQPGFLWIGTENGLASFNGTSFSTLNVSNGIISDTISAITSDNMNQLWLGTPLGLTRITLTDTVSFDCNDNYEGLPVFCLEILGNDLFFGTDLECNKTKIWRNKLPTHEVLETSKLRIYFNNQGYLAHQICESQPGLEFPKDSGKTTIYNANLWLAGYDPSLNLHLMAQKYTEKILACGPFSQNGNYNDTYDSLYNRIWKISQAEIDYHIANWNQPGYTMPEVIRNWPVPSAPYMDLNTNNIYEPQNGEYPLIRGHEAVFSVYNDDRRLSIPGQDKFKVEIGIMAWVYDTTDEALSHTVFFNLNVTNYSSSVYHDVFLGIQSDMDIGSYSNDYIGCDSAYNCYYTYNGTGNDAVYGSHIPSQGLVFLSSPLYSFLYYNNTSVYPYSDPIDPMDFYYNLTGYWKDGTPYTYGGNGYGGTQQVKYVFSGDPVSHTGWSELSENNTPGDRRGLGSIGPFTLVPPKSKCMDFALVTGYDSLGDNLSSVTAMRTNISSITAFYNSQGFHCDTIHLEAPQSLQAEGDSLFLCEGETGLLHVNVAGGSIPYSYSWMPGAGLSDPNIPEPEIQVPSNTSYSVTITDVQGNTVTTTVYVTVYQTTTPAIDSVYQMCASFPLTLSGYSAYWWYDQSHEPVHYFNTSGNYWIMVKDSNGCWSDTAYFDVLLDPAPSVELGPNQEICNNQTITLHAGPGYSSYLWSTGNSDSTIFVDGSLLQPGNYLYRVTVTNPLGCTNTDMIVIKVKDCTSVFFPEQQNNLIVYPNPFGNEITVTWEIPEFKPGIIIIEDLLGNTIQTIDFTGDKEFVIPTNDLSSGIYLLSIIANESRKTIKIIKM